MDQRCMSCGRDTAAGSAFFASRKRGLDREAKVEGYLCYACQPGTASFGSEQSVPLSGRYVVIEFPGAGRGV